jgi:hypothetical protein
MLRLYRTGDIIQGVRSRRLYQVTKFSPGLLQARPMEISMVRGYLGPTLTVNYLAPKLAVLC